MPALRAQHSLNSVFGIPYSLLRNHGQNFTPLMTLTMSVSARYSQGWMDYIHNT